MVLHSSCTNTVRVDAMDHDEFSACASTAHYSFVNNQQPIRDAAEYLFSPKPKLIVNVNWRFSIERDLYIASLNQFTWVQSCDWWSHVTGEVMLIRWVDPKSVFEVRGAEDAKPSCLIINGES